MDQHVRSRSAKAKVVRVATWDAGHAVEAAVLTLPAEDTYDNPITAVEVTQRITNRRWHKFLPGQVVATPGALAAFVRTGTDATMLLKRHLSGDWGDNNCAIIGCLRQGGQGGDRILSAYHLTDGTKIWVITEADRSATTLLLPEEY